MDQKTPETTKKQESLISFLKNYKALIFGVIFLSLIVNLLTLILPRINARVIDSLQNLTYNKDEALMLFGVVTTAILLFTMVQNVLSSITSEKIAAELRRQLIEKISRQSFTYVNQVTASKLLTNLTADVDAVKQFINQRIVFAFAAVVQLIGSIILLLSINWRLAIPVLLTIPILGVSFGVIFSKIEKYFVQGQEVIDKLNRVINESIVGSALVRVLNARRFETDKFLVANEEARGVGTKIVNGFAAIIPIINVVVNVSFLIVMGYGGIQVIDGTLSAGDFSAFFSYIFIFIFPIVMLGFLASGIGRAFATYTRLKEVIDSEEPKEGGNLKKEIEGSIELRKVTLDLENKRILGDINFTVKPKSRVGIIGPTAAGKTQIFYLITGLIQPNEGEILVDGKPINDYDRDNLYSQMGMVFQDSIIFNTTLRENIAFRNEEMSDETIWKAIETAELKDFVDTLPEGLDTKISERGSSLSGGQKQRLTLARALALNPKILLLDDFTARVDINTERKIFANLKQNYPEITVVAITQKIKSIEEFDDIVLVMEGELIATGKHEELLKSSLEYQQIYNSQQRTED
ncbi:MAG: ABC transporter ATP-binding protein [Candidatus Doudnabacteria bacterium]|nr:ABC transporter ATP-binding protein [Candidatus Doudnabacteria bacterium]